MPLRSFLLLLLCLLMTLFSILSFAATPGGDEASPQAASSAAMVSPQEFPQAPRVLTSLQSGSAQDFQLSWEESHPICYRIRAYIFKRDDDRVPEYVRSTTCGPGQPQAREIVSPVIRIRPDN